MSVFNSLSQPCERILTSNISEYYNNVGEYVKSTTPYFGDSDQNPQNSCVDIKDNNINSWPEQIVVDNSKIHYACAFNGNGPKYVQNYHVPVSAQIITQNTPLYNVSYGQQTNRNVTMRYQHYYNIKKHNSLKVNMKKKRKRTIFTTEQIIALEAVFQKKPYINRDEKLILMEKLQVSEKSIKVWFQNRRRLTDNKDNDYESNSPTSDDSSENISDRLTYIETQIQRNTDEYGYVTLNDRVMSDLVGVIDDYLSKDVPWNQTLYDNNHTTILKDGVNNDIVMYEPISPVSLTEILDDFI